MVDIKYLYDPNFFARDTLYLMHFPLCNMYKLSLKKSATYKKYKKKL